MLSRRLVKSVYVAARLHEYLQLRRILRQDQQACAACHAKGTHLKYVHGYAARFLDPAANYKFIAHHYNFALDKLSSARSRALLSGQAHVWEAGSRERHLGIELRRATGTSVEGELVLNFTLNRKIIFMLTFSVFPGAYFDEPARSVIFVGGLQGRPGCREDIRMASKANDEVDPATMLLMALKAVGIAWNIETIVAVSAKYQISADALESAEARFANYDRIWMKGGGIAHGDRVYKLATQSRHGVHAPALGSHRSRTRRKRIVKDALWDDLTARTAQIFAAPAPARAWHGLRGIMPAELASARPALPPVHAAPSQGLLSRMSGAGRFLPALDRV